MSDNQRRIMCRVLFLLACALPTAMTVYKICHPQTAKGWAQAIQANLGIPTSIDSIETPGPDLTRLHGLKFRDPELGTLLEIVEAEIYFGDFNTINIPYRVQGLTNRGLHRLATSLNNHLLRNFSGNQKWRVVFEEELLIEEFTSLQKSLAAVEEKFESQTGPVTSIKLQQIQVDLVPEIDGARADVWFQLAGQEQTDSQVRAAISHSLQKEDWMVFESLHVPLPLWLIADAQPEIYRELGQASEFQGKIDYYPAAGKSSLLINGRIEKVALWNRSELVDEEKRYGLIRFNSCRFENGIPVPGEWDASLYHPGKSNPVPIDSKHLITYRRDVSFNQAIQETMQQQQRIGSLPIKDR